MLDHVSVFSKSGLVLWSRTMAKLKGNPIDDLVQNILLEEKGGSNMVVTEWYTLRWSLANELGLVVVALYQKSLQLHYVERLVDSIKRDIIQRFGPSLKDPAQASPVAYDRHFERLLKQAEAEKGSATTPVAPGRRSYASPSPSPKVNHGARDRSLNAPSGADVMTTSADQSEVGSKTDEPEGKDEVAAARALLKARAAGKGRRGSVKAGRGGVKAGSRGQAGESSADFEGGVGKKEKREKKATVWHDGSGAGKVLGQKAKEALDRSKRGEGSLTSEDALVAEMRSTYMPEDGEIAEWDEPDSDLEDDSDILHLDDDGDLETVGDKDSWAGALLRTSVGSFLHGLTGRKVLEERDLMPVMAKMREQLMSKNVASEVANDITASVQATLINQRLKSFTRVKTAVQSALKEAVSRVLTPKRSTDVLREVNAAKSRGKVYSVTFVGINGVGKSTSLAKVAYYLKENGVKVLIAACDTFRSGAVEQLRVHCRCLQVPLFEKGYAKDSSSVAKEAIKHAQDQGYECVLIDTAGRMQARNCNNEPLMRALSKLINENEPDLVLFVGEALVGNDGVNQLQMFNQASFFVLANNSPAGRLHQIDGVVLTKFDTIDTKVGAALSMCYKTGQPILFVGTGQKYTHLRKFNVTYVMKALFGS
ncbi:unnamed protein product [Ascophyllum nodosum]